MKDKDKNELLILLPKLRRYAYGLTGNKDNGDDLLHNSLEKILKNFSYLKIINFQAYCYKVVSNAWKDELRKIIKTKVVSLDDEKIKDTYEKHIHVDYENNYDQKKNYINVSKSINELSDKLKTTLLLSVVENKTYNDISKILNIPIGTVMSRINESRKILKNKLLNGENNEY